MKAKHGSRTLCLSSFLGFVLFSELVSGATGRTAEAYIGSSALPPADAAAGGSVSISWLRTAINTTAASEAATQYVSRLRALRPEGSNTLRGARDTAIYNRVSPSVVLIFAGDSLGSGTLINDKGLIATNWHVVSGHSTVGVVFKPSIEGAPLDTAQVIRGQVLRFDEVVDLAIVQVATVPPTSRPVEIGSLASVQVGADVHAIGHPTGEAWTYTRGIVSQVRRNYEWTSETHLMHRADVIQTQTPINPGNSGGPLLDDEGQLVGVNSFKSSGEGLNFAVSGDTLKAFLGRSGNRSARTAPTATRKASPTTPSECEPRVVRTWHSKDPPPSAMALMDAACDGRPNVVVRTPDDQKEPVAVLVDSKHQGKIDIVMFDNDRDGNPEFAIYDTNDDGQADLIGYFRNGESEPYRFEPHKK